MADIEAASEVKTHSPKIRHIDGDHPWIWLAAGWNDMWRTPMLSLTFGAIYAVLGIVITLFVVAYDVFYITAPLMAGFMLLGPILAVGLYQISRRLGDGQPVQFSDIFTAWRENGAQIAAMGLILMLFLLAWMRIAQLIFAVFTSYSSPPPDVVGFVNFLLEPGQLPFLIVGTAVGGVLAVIVFAISAISIPLLLERHEVHVIQAIVISVNAVRTNFWPMLLWAWLVAIFAGVGLVTGYLGLIVTLPLIGHATWHAYKDLVDWSEAG